MMKRELELNRSKILEYQKNRDPYLMIDHANKVVPGELSEGYKDLNENEWFFKVHWENDPNMPGMLQIESLVQMCALGILTLDGNKGKVVYLVGADNLKFYRKILPGERLNISTKILSFKRGIAKCYGEGKVKENLACKASFTLALTEKIIKM